MQEDGSYGSGLGITVSNPSLALVNQFLDFLLYSFLFSSNSITIAALRPPITEVLRLRLAREAVAEADRELKSYLGGDDDEDVENYNDPSDAADQCSLEKSWKRCRIQCMNYSSIGDLEEDEASCDSDQNDIVSPAVAIWLTSILEFIGEQILLVSGHASIARNAAKCAREPGSRRLFPYQAPRRPNFL